VRQQFGMMFDLRNSRRPDTAAEATGYTRRWAAFVGIDMPADLEPTITLHDPQPGVPPGSFPSMTVSFEWDDDS
jgi:hypothetical protein